MHTPRSHEHQEHSKHESHQGELPISFGQSAEEKYHQYQATSPYTQISECLQTLVFAGRWLCGRVWHYLRKPTLTDWLVAVATIVIAIYGILQRADTKSAGAQTDRIIAADERIASAMEGNLYTAANVLNATVGQNRLEQRAWLEVHPITVNPPIVAGKILDVRINISNTGRTPAMAVRIAAGGTETSVRDASGKIALPDFTKDTNYLQLGNITVGGSIYSDIVGPVGEGAFNDVIAGTRRWYVHGRVEYSDIFNRPHWVTFCEYLLPTGAFQFCTEHNDIDKDN